MKRTILCTAALVIACFCTVGCRKTEVVGQPAAQPQPAPQTVILEHK